MSDKKRRSQNGAAGASTLNTTSDQRPKCFRDIMDLVLHLSEEEWKSVHRDMTREVTKLEFAVACTKIVTVVSSSIIQRLLKPLCELFSIKVILEANDKLKKMAQSSKCSASYTTAQGSHMEAPDFICDLAQGIVMEIKGAMLEALRRTASGPRLSCSESSLSPADNIISQIDYLSVACTNEICDKLLGLYHSEKLNRATTSGTSHQDGIMKGLGKVVSLSRSSSWFTASSTSDSVSTMIKVTTPDGASSASHAESTFSDKFMSKASQAITEILLKTEQKLSASVSSQTSVPASSETEKDLLMELAKSTATEILEKLYFMLVSRINTDQCGPENEQGFLSFAQKIHMDIHKQVFTFICEQRQAISEKSKTLLDVCTETDAELDIITENIRKSAAAEQFIDKATEVVSDILVKRLTSHISTGSISVKGNRSETQVGEAQVNDADASFSKSFSDCSPDLQSLSSLEESIIDSERTSLLSVKDSLYAPLHIFTVVHNQLKAFFTSFTKSADDNTRMDGLADSESDEDRVFPIHISEEGLVHELDVGRSFSDSVQLRRNSMLCSVLFPSELIYRFVEESTKALLQNVLNISNGSDGCSPHPAEDQEKKKTRPRVHVVLRMSRKVVIKHSKKKRSVPSPSVSADLQEVSHKESKSVFKRLGRFFSNLSKNFTDIFNSSETRQRRPEPANCYHGYK